MRQGHGDATGEVASLRAELSALREALGGSGWSKEEVLLLAREAEASGAAARAAEGEAAALRGEVAAARRFRDEVDMLRAQNECESARIVQAPCRHATASRPT